jgi:hypothetical protein
MNEGGVCEKRGDNFFQNQEQGGDINKLSAARWNKSHDFELLTPMESSKYAILT